MKRLRNLLAALRDFTRGFLGLTSPTPVDADAARRQILEKSERRPHCC